MSLIADLLAKLNRQEPSGDVPPGLRRVVEADSGQKTQKRRIVVLSIILLAVIVTGAAALFAVDQYVSSPKAPVVARIPQQPVSGPPAAPPPVQVSPALSQTSSTPAQKPDEQKSPGQNQAGPNRPAEKPAPQAGADVFRSKQQTEKERKQTKAAAAEPREQVRAILSSQGSPDQTSERNLHLYTAKAHEVRRDYQQALASYRKALEHDPVNYIVLNNIAGTLVRLGSAGEAVKYARQALTVRQDYVPAMINIGVAGIQSGNLTEGELYLNKAFSYEPGNRTLLLNLGLLYERQGSPERAASFYSKLADVRDVQGQLGLARIAEKQGRKTDAALLSRAAGR
ncbi:MAG TPA: tetratricopeptide repeat protein [Dissulfurispiraceae bacterium]|nr:tetratricopeptide repeat protein [Dissulfurispiraceae bacterium]